MASSEGANAMTMSHTYNATGNSNAGLGLSVKQNQLRHSQHFQQQML